jgi:hypothetical protein
MDHGGDYATLADLSGRIRTCGQNKLHARLFGEERANVGFEDQWIDLSSIADRDPFLTVDKNSQRHFSQMAWINKGPTTSTIWKPPSSKPRMAPDSSKGSAPATFTPK